MNNNPLLINILFIMFISIHLACSGDNSKPSVQDYEDVQTADLQSSECLANSYQGKICVVSLLAMHWGGG